MLYIINPNVFLAARIVLFFVATIFIFKALQAINFEKIFKRNTGDQIRFILMVVSIIMGYLFVDAIMSLFEWLNQLL